MLSAKAKITYAVISFHLLALASPLFFKETIQKQDIKPIAVTTYTLPAPEKKTVVAVSAPPKPKPTPPKKNTPPKKKKAEVKPTPKPSKTKKNTDSLQKELREIQKSIAKIEEENDKMSTKSKLKDPPKISFSKIAPKQETNDLSTDVYAASLVSYLQTHLQLPDIGEVKIQLTLRPNGSVEKLIILSAKSEKNKKRLEEDLPQLILPALPKKRAPNKSETFVLTFCNEL